MQNHRHSGILNFKDIADHWIGYPKSPYTSYTVTANTPITPTTPATSAPLRSTKKPKRRKNKKTSNNKRRHDIDDYADYKETRRNREKHVYDDFDYDYDGPIDTPYDGRTYAPSPYIIRSSGSTPNVAMVKPSVSSNSQMIKAVYAGTPKVATYVIPNAKKYVVQRVKSELVYAPPASIPPSPAMYTAASTSGMRRLDPLDYDDNDGGAGGSFLNLGPQDSFPPRPVMNKIAQPGQQQPCHGPDCHQHHKGLVRFYWRRVVYPPNSRGRRRPGGRTRRRRFRVGGRSPSDQKDVYLAEDDDEDSRDNGNSDDNNEEDEEEEEEEGDNEETNSGRRNIWQPGKAYGHDLNEGSNYDDEDRKAYRDKRYTYRNYRKRRRGNFQ